MPGAPGAPGIAGEPGTPGSGEVALFYGFNLLPVAPGGDVDFAANGISTADGIVRSTPAIFTLVDPGVYRVTFQVPVNEAGQLVLAQNGVELPYTVTGRATGTTSIGQTTLVQTTGVNETLSVRNPASSSWALTLPLSAGGPSLTYATLLIELVKED